MTKMNHILFVNLTSKVDKFVDHNLSDTCMSIFSPVNTQRRNDVISTLCVDWERIGRAFIATIHRINSLQLWNFYMLIRMLAAYDLWQLYIFTPSLNNV